MRILSVQLTSGEYAALRAEAAEREMTVSGFLRQEIGVLREMSSERARHLRPRGYGKNFRRNHELKALPG
jgi:hypothetical protein